MGYGVTAFIDIEGVPLTVYVFGTVLVVDGRSPAVPFVALDGVLDIGPGVGCGIVPGGTLPSEHPHERHSGNDDYDDRGQEKRDDYGDPSQVHSTSSSGCKYGVGYQPAPSQTLFNQLRQCQSGAWQDRETRPCIP